MQVVREFAGFMVWVLPAPDIYIRPFDALPIVAVVEQVQEQEVVTALRTLSVDAKEKIEGQRIDLKRRMLAYIAFLTHAELEGWPLDCGPVILILKTAMDQAYRTCNPLKTSLRRLAHSAIRQRMPGSNQVNTYAMKISGYLDAYLNDLEDYHSELVEVNRRIALTLNTAPITRAAVAYEYAIESVLGKKVKPQSRLNAEIGDASLWFSIPIGDDIRRDRVRRKEVEEAIHSSVAKTDPTLVGLAALRYEMPSA